MTGWDIGQLYLCFGNVNNKTNDVCRGYAVVRFCFKFMNLEPAHDSWSFPSARYRPTYKCGDYQYSRCVWVTGHCEVPIVFPLGNELPAPLLELIWIQCLRKALFPVRYETAISSVWRSLYWLISNTECYECLNQKDMKTVGTVSCGCFFCVVCFKNLLLHQT
jgi:hypothetical protein